MEQRAFSDYQFEGRSLQSHLEFEESWEDRGNIKVNFSAIRGLGILVLVLVGLFLAFVLLVPATSPFYRYGSIILSFLAVGSVTTLLFESVLKELFKSLTGLVFERNVRHVSAKPAFSSEKFNELFREIVRKASTGTGDDTKRLIFVFDNLDRSSEEVAIEAIGVIKTFLDEPGCVYIVPCDESVLVKHIAKSYTGDKEEESQRQYAREFLNKFFQATLRFPMAISYDMEAYLDCQLEAVGMSDLPQDAKDVLVLGCLGNTPRQVKRALNDLIACRALALRAEEEGLVQPGELTSDLSLLTKISVISAEWPDFLSRLADDPDLWAELMDNISTGRAEASKGVNSKLISFLHATRHVSSGADIRPFVYLKRVAYEKNAALAKQVDGHLRKGEAEKFVDLLKQTPEGSGREEIIRMAADLARHWLDATPPRDVFLRNATPVLLKAANALRGNRRLDLLVSDLLGHLSSSEKPLDIAEVVDPDDLFAFEPSVPTSQKASCIERLVSVFHPSVPSSRNQIGYWKQFLSHQGQLTASLRTTLREYIESRYAGALPETLQLLFEAAQRKPVPGWVVGDGVLRAVAAQVSFLDDEVDRQRVVVLERFQAQLPEDAKDSVAATIKNAVQGSRGRTFDVQVRSATEFLSHLDPPLLGAGRLTEIGNALTEQVSAHGNNQEKALWLAPLINIYEGLPANVQANVDGLYRPQLTDPNPPNALVDLLSGLKQPTC
jgi:hypothetical protein